MSNVEIKIKSVADERVVSKERKRMCREGTSFIT